SEIYKKEEYEQSLTVSYKLHMELYIENLSKYYGEKLALDKFTYTFKEGTYAILGPNGAGKSTLMHLITDNISRSGGQIFYDGKDILQLGRSFRKKIGFMPQSQGMYDQMSAKGFLSYMAEIKGIPKKEARGVINELLSVVNLSDVSHKKLSSFSGGMRQRILLAQALLGKPDILMLDEPTAGLDPEERVRIRTYIGNLAASKIVLITTHITSDVESIADYVIFMKNGRIEAFGKPERILKETCSENMEEAYLKIIHTEGQNAGT
ncbi:MAG TPA: ATP-binding cassette domain-containing protein, partial [Clostridia bacterium]|nr:ATP-binding cassette domain-containing protein [Clostridia bacterium]HOT70415.1 ATP-binding cassette domain-containing protein [Clostridia bacterium]HQG00643.1 ATP-binding cassette domain-containing protein [Clostridia bacterium]HQH64770.1 ATP-binding cassette domain-containing protein [Clostridia bacterium]HQJ91259.1 ATP-binding cassette domain-containing protein [Clostridia bacterium]